MGNSLLSHKVTGGPVRASVLSESKRITWFLSTTAHAKVKGSMQNFTRQTFETSEQLQNARRCKDEMDIKVMVSFLQAKNLLIKNTTLKNIAFGFVADTTKVDVYKAEEVGKQILKSMVGKMINEFSFKCSNQTKTLVAQSKNAVKIGNDVLPQLLFQMITRAACE